MRPVALATRPAESQVHLCHGGRTDTLRAATAERKQNAFMLPNCWDIMCEQRKIRIKNRRPLALELLALASRQRTFRSTVTCYTLLSGFRLPWPPSCCLNESTPFVVSDELEFRHLNPTFGSSRIASSAYQKWPTKNSLFEETVQLSNCPIRPI